MASPFVNLHIRNELIHQLQRLGITEPTPIQKKAIPLLLAGNDVIAQAQTGTGKTLAFVLPILETINVQQSSVQALIITPTRELAIQIAAEVKKLAPVVGAHVLAAYGGQDVESQLHKLQGNIHIVIGTPGRLLDHLRRGSVHFGKLQMLVLDEADQMLHMGFLAEVQDIISQTSSKRQTLLFSATMPAQIRNLAKQYMREPIEVQVEAKRITLDEIEQVVVETTDRGKQAALVSAIQEYNPYLAMVFCRTKRRASALNEALQELGFASDELHGDLSQSKREQVMKRFREAKIQILVATDMAARGIDVEGVSHVFNYDIPHDVESYIHRIGRTGRAGNTGVAVTFVAGRDKASLEMIERGIAQTIRSKAGNTRVRTVREGDSVKPSTGGRRRGAEESNRGRRRRNGSEMSGEGRGGRRNRGELSSEGQVKRKDRNESQRSMSLKGRVAATKNDMAWGRHQESETKASGTFDKNRSTRPGDKTTNKAANRSPNRSENRNGSPNRASNRSTNNNRNSKSFSSPRGKGNTR